MDGKEVVLIVDDAAVKSLVDNFNAEKAAAKGRGENYQVLVDADHSSETGDTTKAMARVDRIFDDPDRGLVGVFVFTKEGADAVSGKAYRFISPAWTLTDDGHPEKPDARREHLRRPLRDCRGAHRGALRLPRRDEDREPDGGLRERPPRRARAGQRARRRRPNDSRPQREPLHGGGDGLRIAKDRRIMRDALDKEAGRG